MMIRLSISSAIRTACSHHTSKLTNVFLPISAKGGNSIFSPKCCPVTSLKQHASFISTKADYLCVHVFVTCKHGTEDAFKASSLENAHKSCKEHGIARFDVIQQVDDPCKFVLVEVYKNEQAPAAHKETDHYKVWREEVAEMMEIPRKAITYKNC